MIDRSRWPFEAIYSHEEWGEARWDFLVRGFEEVGQSALAFDPVLEIGTGGRADNKALWSRRHPYRATEPRPDGIADDSYAMDDMPYPDGSFGIVLLTDVLEHVRTPASSIRNCHRVLRDGGILFCSVPFFTIGEHGDSDYWRFTHDGLVLVFRGTDPWGTGSPTLRWQSLDIERVGSVSYEGRPDDICRPLGYLIKAKR